MEDEERGERESERERVEDEERGVGRDGVEDEERGVGREWLTCQDIPARTLMRVSFLRLKKSARSVARMASSSTRTTALNSS